MLLDTAAAALSKFNTLHLNAAGVDFIDLAGISTLMQIGPPRASAGAGFAVTGCPARVQHVLELLGLTSVVAASSPGSAAACLSTLLACASDPRPQDDFHSVGCSAHRGARRTRKALNSVEVHAVAALLDYVNADQL